MYIVRIKYRLHVQASHKDSYHWVKHCNSLFSVIIFYFQLQSRKSYRLGQILAWLKNSIAYLKQGWNLVVSGCQWWLKALAGWLTIRVEWPDRQLHDSYVRCKIEIQPNVLWLQVWTWNKNRTTSSLVGLSTFLFFSFLFPDSNWVLQTFWCSRQVWEALHHILL